MTEAFQRLAGALADRYRLERELGSGGMATVWLAQDIRHDRDVAIKVLHPDLGAALGGERFLAEIRTTARLQHPHILPLLDSGDAAGLLYYVMPLATGETLRDRLARERQLPVPDAIRIAREVADALGHAHAQGIIHRDIKPENILLQGGHAVVADFGIALAVEHAGAGRMTQTGLSLGTPQYMSPEQAMGERSIDARSDVYALGAVTYEMLVGEPPFTGPSVQAIVARLLTEEPRPIVAQRKAVPDGIEAAVMRALEKLPADRFATAGEFGAALQDASSVPAAAAGHRTSVAPSAAASRAWTHRNAIAGGAVGLLTAGVLLGWLASPRLQSASPNPGQLTVTSVLAPPGGAFGEQRSLALTRDGRRLAFVFSASDGSRMLWRRDFDRLEPEPIPRTAGARAPFWSPDGRSIGFFAEGYLTIVDPSGESRRLCPAAEGIGGSWSGSGVILFSHREGLSTVSAGGGECRLLVPRGNGPSLKGEFLPDGNRILYSRSRLLDMVVASLDGKQLGTVPVRTGEFTLVASGYLISQDRADPRALDAQRINLRTLALEGDRVRLVTDVRSQNGVHTYAASASTLAYLPGMIDRPYLEYDATGRLRDTVRVDGTWTLSVRAPAAGPPYVAVAGNAVGLWLYDLDTDRSTRLAARDSTMIGGQGRAIIWPVFSPDGRRIVFAANAPGQCRIVERDLTTDTDRLVSRERNAAEAATCPNPLDWSTDGRTLLVRRDTTLQLASVTDLTVSTVLARPGSLWDGRFSPDGRLIAFSSDETGRTEAYVLALPSGQPIRVSLDGGRWPTWTHGGRQLTFITPDGRVQQAGLDPAGRPQGSARTLFTVPTWRRSTFDDRGTGLAVVGDGERYLVRQSPASPAVALMQNWTRLLEAADSTGRR